MHTILAVVDAPTPELAALAADRLTERLRAKPDLFPEVRRPDGGAFFEKNGLLFLPVEQVGQTLGQLEAASPFITMLARDPSWRGLSQAVQAVLGMAQKSPGGLDPMAPVFDRFSKTFEDINAGRPGSFSWQELLTGEKPKASDLRKFVDITPKLDYSALDPGKQAIEPDRDGDENRDGHGPAGFRASACGWAARRASPR